MPDEGERRFLMLEMQSGIIFPEDVGKLLGLMETGMHQAEAVFFGDQGEILQPLDLFLGEFLPGIPDGSGNSLQCLNDPLRRGHLIVISHDRDRASGTHEFETLGWSRPIADYIAQAEDLIGPMGIDICKHRLQCIDVRMNVGNEGYARHGDKILGVDQGVGK